MALMDEFKEERERVKNGTPKEKMAYFWEYYKWYVIIPAVVIIAIASHIHHVMTTPDTLVSGVVLNGAAMETEELINGFYEEEEIDTKEYSVDINTSVTYMADSENAMVNYESMQALMAWVSAGTIDYIGGDFESVSDFAYKEYFVDLREILDEEQIEKYEPYFLYMDYALIVEANAAYANNEDVSAIIPPDCTKPEEMEDPIPVMLDVSECDALAKVYSDGKAALGIAAKAPNVEMTLKFIDYMMEN